MYFRERKGDNIRSLGIINSEYAALPRSKGAEVEEKINLSKKEKLKGTGLWPNSE